MSRPFHGRGSGHRPETGRNQGGILSGYVLGEVGDRKGNEKGTWERKRGRNGD